MYSWDIMGISKKVKIPIDRELADELIKMKGYGDTYSTVIRKLIAFQRAGK